MGHSCRGIFVVIENCPSLQMQRSKLKASTTKPGTLPGIAWLWDLNKSTPPPDPQFRPPEQPVGPANHQHKHKPRTGCFQEGNNTQKWMRDGKSSQKRLGYLSWSVGSPGGTGLPGRGTTAGDCRTVGTPGVAQPQTSHHQSPPRCD